MPGVAIVCALFLSGGELILDTIHVQALLPDHLEGSDKIVFTTTWHLCVLTFGFDFV